MQKKGALKKEAEACFGAGCFWGVQSVFDQTIGVLSTDVGFMGGNMKLDKEHPYPQVCTDTTGHAEVVYIKYDPKKVSYIKLVDIFFDLHDPTQKNRQGPDVGSQYRSVIFYYTSEQQKEALEAIKRHQKKYKQHIVTIVEKASVFYRAEEYHQKYLAKRGQTTCHI